MEILSAIVGVVALIGSLVSAGVQMHNDKKTQDYNKDLNQTVMEREDNSWQRAVADRSAAGLSVSGLSSGAGSGGTVSQLQAPQGAGQLANILSGASNTAFGLANSAYDRKLQKQISSDELKIKKDELDMQKNNLRAQRLTSAIQARIDLIQATKELKLVEDQISSNASRESRDQAIYTHNMDLARRLDTVYGQVPNVPSVILGKGSEILSQKKDDILNSVDEKKQAVVNYFNDSTNPITGTTSKPWSIPSDKLKEALGPYTYDSHFGPGVTVSNWSKSADGKSFYLYLNTPKGEKTVEISKYQFDKMEDFRKVKKYRP